MKPNYTPLFILLFVFSTIVGVQRSGAQTPADYTFSIHLGTFVNAQISDFDNVRSLGFVYAEKFQNNLLQIYLGEFATEASAGPLLNQVRTGGYPDAYVTRKNLQQGERVYIIKLGNASPGEAINWESYAKAGPMYVMLRNQQVSIATGVFESSEEASQRLEIVKKLGYTNANVLSLNNIYLHEISTFETGGEIILPEVELVVEAPEIETVPATEEVVPEEVVPEVVVIEENTTAPVQEEVLVENVAQKEEPLTTPVIAVPITISNGTEVATQKEEPTPPPVEMIPTSYDDVLASRSPLAEAQPNPDSVEEDKVMKPRVVAAPYIRPKVKRTSAIELQKVLKKEGTYKGSLDGFYGRGTKTGYQEIMAGNAYIQRYKMIANANQQWQEKGMNKEVDSPFMQWEPLKLLLTVARDLDPNPAFSQTMVESYAGYGQKLFNTPVALGREEQKAIIDWNTALWKGLDSWTAEDPIHKKMTMPLKVAYYQSMVLIEDHLMNEGLQPLEAKGVSLSILQSIVAPYLESYKK